MELISIGHYMKIQQFLSVLLFIGLLSFNGYSQTIIASFEDQKDLQNIHQSEGVDISQSTDFAALGAFSCRAAFPEHGGSLSIISPESFHQTSMENSSSDVELSLLCFIWTSLPASIGVVIEDSLNQIFNRKYTLKAGANHLQIPLSEVGKLDLRRIKSIGITTTTNIILYLDYIALDQYQPVLAKLGRWDVEYGTEIKTPHYPWGSELVGGPIKSYSLSPIFDGRGIIELAERLHLDFQVTTIGRSQGAEKYGYGDFYMRRSPGHGGDSTTYNLAHNYIAEDLLFSPEFDVIIWPGIHLWESYPKEVRNSIIERVNNGTGLVLIYPISDQANSDLWDISPLKGIGANKAQSKIVDAEISTMPDQLDQTDWSPVKPHYITRGIAFDAFPWGSTGAYPYQNNGGDVLVESTGGNPVLSVKNHGKGRIVAMGYPERGLLPRVNDPWATGLNYPYWEYMWSLVARSVVWAAGKEPENFIREARPGPDGVVIDLENEVQQLTVEVQLLDEFGTIEEEITSPAEKGQSVIELGFSKRLNGGKHILNIRLKGDEGVYDWYSVTFETKKIAKISSVENNQPEIPFGEKVRTTVFIESDQPVDGSLMIRLYDNYGRLADEVVQEISVKGQEKIDVILNSENVLTNLGKSEYFLNIDGHQVDRKRIEHFFLRPRVWDDYDVTMYHFGPNPIPGVWPAVDQQLQELNVTTLAAYTLANSKNANYKVQAQTRIQGVESPDSGPDLEYYKNMKIKYLETNDKSVLKRKYGLKDSVYLNSVKVELSEMLGEWKKFSPSAYYIYEEPSLTRYNDALDLCFRESTLASMRLWLKQEYQSLDTLNEQWGTNFNQWSEVIPDDSREAIERGNYSSWADHRTFMEICWADQFKFVQDIVQEHDPGGLVQLSGTQAASSHNGYDYSRLNKYVGQMNPYDIDNQLEYHHNFNADLKVSGQAGYGALGKDVLYDYYHHLFLKETGGSYVFWQASCLNPDLSICQSGADLKAGFDELLKRGIGRLLVSYQPENELKIAIHFSYPSVHASWIVDGKISPGTQDNLSNTLKQFNRNRDGWVKILHDSGLGFDFISYDSIENDGLGSNGYQVLILPMSYALSDNEVEQIESFVRKGGVLIADALPGVMDDHAKFRSTRALAKVFGIEARAFTREELVIPENEPTLNTTTGSVLANQNGTPELVYNEYGEGKAYLLNYFMDNYPEQRLNNSSESTLRKIRELMTRENLQSNISLTTGSGVSAHGVEKYSFSESSGAARILGLLPGQTTVNSEINLQLKDTVHLYDIRNSKYLGEGSSFKIGLKTSVPELFGLVQGKIEGIKVTAPSGISQGEKITLDFEIAGSELSGLKSAVTINVFNPKGERVPYYGDNCDIINGSGTYTFNTALDDPSGIWKIGLTEVISGIEEEVLVELR
ncbi:MAG: hypothetical protein DHS20C17_31890 [Cyclobacteriaceae bacterium]|nr:MAG: hypothetical protein DHS20C17_31890 [Cyclobacteriaceae bacterium]